MRCCKNNRNNKKEKITFVNNKKMNSDGQQANLNIPDNSIVPFLLTICNKRYCKNCQSDPDKF